MAFLRRSATTQVTDPYLIPEDSLRSIQTLNTWLNTNWLPPQVQTNNLSRRDLAQTLVDTNDIQGLLASAAEHVNEEQRNALLNLILHHNPLGAELVYLIIKPTINDPEVLEAISDIINPFLEEAEDITYFFQHIGPGGAAQKIGKLLIGRQDILNKIYTKIFNTRDDQPLIRFVESAHPDWLKALMSSEQQPDDRFREAFLTRFIYRPDFRRYCIENYNNYPADHPMRAMIRWADSGFSGVVSRIVQGLSSAYNASRNVIGIIGGLF